MRFLEIHDNVDVEGGARDTVHGRREAADDHVGRADPFQGAQDVNEETEVELAVVRHGQSPPVF
jgi:hypothetical protein